MSNIRADNFGKRDGSSSITADTLLQGTAKAWVSFNGTGVISAFDSFNLSSLADLGVGSYQHNYSVSMPNGNQAGAGCADRIATFSDSYTVATLFTTSKYQFVNFEGGAATDSPRVGALVVGDPS